MKASLDREARIQEIVSNPITTSDQGLKPHETTALALIMADRDAESAGVRAWNVKVLMETAGFTKVAAGLALTSLVRRKFLELSEEIEDHGETYKTYCLTRTGEDWLLTNQDSLELVAAPKPTKPVRPHKFETSDDDVPF